MARYWEEQPGVQTQADDVATSIPLRGRRIYMVCLSGNLWVDGDKTAVAATGWKLPAGSGQWFTARQDLSVVSDANGATYQYFKPDEKGVV
jgi:hypothetical protein